MDRRIARWALAAAAALAVLTATATARASDPRAAHTAARSPRGGDYDAPTEAWREGPVRYLLSKDEDEAYRALTDDAAREAFIQHFWTSRDPDPSTTDNEYRLQFFGRVRETNRMFTDSTKPGWKTDRGKIYILLGPPDDLEQEQARDGLVPDVITWTYRSPPGGLFAESLPLVRFARDPTGEYRMTNDVFIHGFESNTGITFQVQAMQVKSLPEQKKLLDTIAGTTGRVDSGPFRTHRDFFRSGQDTTFAILTLGVKPDLLDASPALTGEAAEAAAALFPPAASSAAPAPTAGAGAGAAERYEVLARLVGQDPATPSYDFTGPAALRSGSDRPVVDPSGYEMFQGGRTVRPGRYTAFYGVVDRKSGHVRTFREPVEVPDLRLAALSLGPITLASRLERLDRGSNTYTTPFVLGNLRVLPRPDDQFKNGEDFSFYFQVYGPAMDPIDGRPDLDVEYQFFVAQRGDAGGLKFVALGKTIRQTRQRGQIQGYALPLRDWPPGTYRLRVQVKDNLTEARSTREVSFRVL